MAVAAAVATACSSDDSGGGSDGSGSDGSGASGTTAGPGTTTEVDLPAVPDGLPDDLFALGVASGDPLPDSVILWTRLVADPLATDGGVGAEPIPVRWEISTDEEFSDVVADGGTVTDVALAHSVHIDPSGLEPDSWYWYRFTVGDRVSPVGRTRTAPAAGSSPDRLRFAFASCQNMQAGHWSAHRRLVEEEIDLVVFLGDYIYEDSPNTGAVRTYRSSAPVDLDSYRQRWGDYKSDPDLQAVHAAVPWVNTWDDHEVVNNYAGLVPEGVSADDEAAIAEFVERRRAAYQVFYEHLPLRLDPPDEDDFVLHRSVAWGDLANFVVLDTRQHRSDQIEGIPGLPADAGPITAEARDESRTILGPEQEAWLGEELSATEARWNVIAQAVVMAPFPFLAEVYNLDQWDGYPAARRRLLEQLDGVSNPVVISGDVHLSALGHIPSDPADPASQPLATEIVGTSISSTFPADFVDLIETTASALPYVSYVNAKERGYVVCDLTSDELRIDYRVVSTTSTPDAEVETRASYVVPAGTVVPQPT